MNTVIYNARLVDAKMDSKGMVVCENGKIKSIFLGEFDTEEKARNVVESEATFFDAKKLTLMPAFIDMHAHFRYPGQPQKEDLKSGIEAAFNSGFGTLVLMPNTNPVVSDSALAKSVMDEAKNLKVDTFEANDLSTKNPRFFQTVSLTKNFEGNDTSALDNLNSKIIPVISEDGHDVESTSVMLDAMEKAAKNGVIVACHCEDVTLAQKARPFRQTALKIMKENNIPAGIFSVPLASAPESVNKEIDKNLTRANEILALAEDTATERNLEIAALAGCHIHICHCSTKVSMDAVRNAKNRGIDCSVEVTPHHLGLTGTELPNIRALVNPPLRSENDRRALIEALRDGTADCIGTDHAPHTMEDKAAGSPGFTGIETAFAVCNSILCKEEGFSLSRLSELMSANPAKLLNLETGRLEIGKCAEFALVNPDEEWTVDASKFKSKGKSTPLDTRILTGKVHKTILL